MGRLRSVPRVVFWCVLFLAIPGAAFGQSNSAFSVAGTVFSDAGDRRIVNATVVLCDDQGGRLQETNSNDSGEFSFRAVRAARYILRVRAEGYETTELHVDLSLGSQHGISVALKALRAKDAPVSDQPTISAHELSMPEAARNLMASGRNKLYKQNDPQGALSEFQAASQKAPNYYEAYLYAGLAFLSLHKDSEAETQFRKSIEVSQQKYPDAEIALAALLLRRGQSGEGETLLRQGLALNPQSWPGQVELGKLEFARGHLESALEAAEKAQSLAPLQPIVYRLLAAVHLQQKNFPAAVSDLDNYIRLDPDSPAGVRAKELRAQVQQQLPASSTTAATANR